MSFDIKKIFPFLAWLPQTNKSTLRADLIAGLTGAVIVLPQGVAFATIAGLPPEYGLYTAMVTPIVAALFGSSLHLISGPTTAISIVIFSSISRYAEPGSAEFIQMALTITLLAGIYQFAFGVARLGVLVNFVSHTVVIGFTAGAAILIFTSQVKHVLGVFVPKGESFLHTWIDIWNQVPEVNFYVLGIAMITLVVALFIKKRFPSLPNLLLGLVVGSLLALLFGSGHEIKLVGKIPGHLPPLSAPDFSLEAIKTLAPQAFAVALLGLIEAVSISRAISTKSGQRIDANQEFVGQGLSNMVGSFFSSYAGSGSFTRSGVNYSAGAKTPMSAIFAAVVLMLIVLLIAPLTAYLPVAAMGGVILIVAYNLIDFGQIKHILTTSKTETSILLTTFFATLFLELEFAIYLGVLLSLVLFLAKTSTPDIVTLSPDAPMVPSIKRGLVDIRSKPVKQCPHIKILRVDMSIYFGSVNHIQSRLAQIVENERIYRILIIGSGINFVDLSGTEMLMAEAKKLEKLGGGLYFVDLKPLVYDFLSRSHFVSEIGNSHFFDEKTQAIKTIYNALDKTLCSGCAARVFSECQ